MHAGQLLTGRKGANVAPEDGGQQRQRLGVFLLLHLPERVLEASCPQARVPVQSKRVFVLG